MPLPIIQTSMASKKLSLGEQRRVFLEAKYERAWHLDPEQFNPHHSLEEMDRFDRAWSMIEKLLDAPLHIADLACGYGLLTRQLLDRGHSVDAVDVSSLALNQLPPHEKLRKFQQAVPRTRLEDGAYDGVVALDLLNELHPDEYRLFMSEVQRLMRRRGFALISSPLDHTTNDPLGFFLDLLNKEFKVVALKVSYHRFRDCNSKWFMEKLEAISRFLFPDSGVTHAMALVEKKELKF